MLAETSPVLIVEEGVDIIKNSSPPLSDTGDEQIN